MAAGAKNFPYSPLSERTLSFVLGEAWLRTYGQGCVKLWFYQMWLSAHGFIEVDELNLRRGHVDVLGAGLLAE